MTLFRSMCAWFMVAAMLFTVLPTDLAAQRSRGGGSFGGSRSSGRSYSMPRSAPRSYPQSSPSRPSTSPSTSPSGGGSMGGSRRSSTAPTSTGTNSFGGSRLSTGTDYTSRYGTPRRSQPVSVPTTGGSTNYVVHRYGGMGDGFMMGYLMGSIPWYYSMPFHPAYYYSRPYTAVNPDGTVSVYPGTFQWGQLFFMLLLVAGGGYIIYVWLRGRRQRRAYGSADMSKSSFG